MIEENFRNIWILLILTVSVTATSYHQSCDGTSSTNNVESLIESHIQRLMSLRHPSWGWYNTPDVVLTLQLSNQQAFFARNRAFKAMKREFAKEMNNTSLGKLAMYAMAVRSLCKDPTNFNRSNLLQKLKHRLRMDLNSDKGNKPWYSYALALQALCVNNINLGKTELRKILRSQSPSGSFDVHSTVDVTAQMMIALQCVSKQNAISQHLARQVNNTVKLAAKFLKSQITYFMDSVWIGNKYSTPLALLALKSVDGIIHRRKKMKIIRSMRSCDPTDEFESAVTQRLLALRNNNVLNLRDNWQCLTETDPIPAGYTPNFSEQPPGECPLTREDDDNPYKVLIDVRLSFATGASNGTVLVTGVRKDSTLLQVMNKAKCEVNFTFDIKQTSWGPSVQSINGVLANSSMNQYWSLQDATSGEFLSAGVGQYRPSDNEHILFKLTTY